MKPETFCGQAKGELRVSGPGDVNTAAAQKLRYLESTRGIAACVVVLTHFVAAFHPCLVFGQHCASDSRWAWALWSSPLGLTVAGNAAVNYFFLLSGYVLSRPFLRGARDRADLAGSLLKRPLRLGGLVVGTEVLALALWYASAYANGDLAAAIGGNDWFAAYWRDDLRSLGLPWSLFTVPLVRSVNAFNPPLWTITVELFGSVQIFLFLMLFGRSRYRAIVAAALLVLFASSPYLGFWIGLMFAELEGRRAVAPRYARTIAPAVLLIGLWLCSYPGYLDKVQITNTVWSWLPESGLYGMPSLLGASLVFAAVQLDTRMQRGLSTPWLAPLGRWSYAIYAVHFPILGAVAASVFVLALPRFGRGFAEALAFVGGMGMVVLAAAALTRWLDVPSTRLANAIGAAAARSVRRLRGGELTAATVDPK